MQNETGALAATLLLAYQEGYTVPALSALTGLREAEVVRRLCVASRHLARQPWVIVDPEGALGVQWEYVAWKS